MPTPFVHLHLHTEYSLVDGTVRIKPLVERAAALGMPAIAVTDQHNLFALVKFYQAAEAAGIKPLIGADVLLRSPDDSEQVARLVLLCQDRHGYLNLCQLLSRAYLEGQHHGMPFLRRDWVFEHAGGLIAHRRRRPRRARATLERSLAFCHRAHCQCLSGVWHHANRRTLLRHSRRRGPARRDQACQHAWLRMQELSIRLRSRSSMK